MQRTRGANRKREAESHTGACFREARGSGKGGTALEEESESHGDWAKMF